MRVKSFLNFFHFLRAPSSHIYGAISDPRGRRSEPIILVVLTAVGALASMWEEVT